MNRIPRSKITDYLENTLVEVFERTHKCPWYKRLNKHYGDQFYYERTSDGIGTSTIVCCKKCGKKFDVTNYNNW